MMKVIKKDRNTKKYVNSLKKEFTVYEVDSADKIKTSYLYQKVGQPTIVVGYPTKFEEVKEFKSYKMPEKIRLILVLREQEYAIVQKESIKSKYQLFKEQVVPYKPDINRKLLYELYRRVQDPEVAKELIDKGVVSVRGLDKLVPKADIYPSDIFTPMLAKQRYYNKDKQLKMALDFVDKFGNDYALNIFKKYFRALYNEKMKKMLGDTKFTNPYIDEIRVNEVFYIYTVLELLNNSYLLKPTLKSIFKGEDLECIITENSNL